jgi:hypothetical protein
MLKASDSRRFFYRFRPWRLLPAQSLLYPILFLNDISKIDTDTKPHPSIYGPFVVAGFDLFLNRRRTLHRIDNTDKFCQQIVAW